MTTQLELQIRRLEQLRRTTHRLIDWSTHVSNLLHNNNADIDRTLRTISSLHQSPSNLTKYETVVQGFEANFDTNLLQLTFLELGNTHSHDELQAIESQFRELAETIAPDPHLHL